MHWFDLWFGPFGPLPLGPVLPDPSPEAPPGMGFVSKLLAWLKWGGLVAAVAGIIIGAVMLFFGRNFSEGAKKIVLAIIGVVVILGAVSLVSAVMLGA